MTGDTVLLVTASYDEAAKYVSDCLEQIGVPYFRLDTDRFPTEIKATYDPYFGLVLEDKRDSIHSKQIRSVWYRRNVAPILPDYIDRYE